MAVSHRRLSAALAFCALVAELTWSQASAAAQLKILRIDGRTEVRDALASADLEWLKFQSGEPLKRDDVRSIEADPIPAREAGLPPAVTVLLAGLGELPGRSVTLGDDVCEVELPDGQRVKIALEDLVAISYADDPAGPVRAALAQPPKEHDLLIVRTGQQITTVRAFIESVKSTGIEFDWEGKTRTLQTAQVLGIIFAKTPGAAPVERPYRIQLSSSSVIAASQLKAGDDGKSWKVEVSPQTSFDMPADSLEKIAVHSSRLTFLSDLKPVRVTEKPIVAFPRPWQADRNVRGERLKAADLTFEKGIGVQSGSSLTFELPAGAGEFAAVATLDPPPGQTGDCEFVIVADGRELARQRVHGAEKPVTIRTQLAGARQLELRVDYGRDLDFGDHANWCDAHIVTSSSSTESKAVE